MCDESPAHRRLRLYREEKARNKALVETRAAKAQRKQDLRAKREKKRRLGQDLIELGQKLKASVMQQDMTLLCAAANHAAKVAERTRWNLCKCCGDDKDIKKCGMCEQCWREKAYGVIEPPPVSERQLKSALCRNVRKGHEMS